MGQTHLESITLVYRFIRQIGTFGGTVDNNSLKTEVNLDSLQQTGPCGPAVHRYHSISEQFVLINT